MGYLQGYLIAVYLFVGLVAATKQQPQPNGIWLQNKEYRYKLSTRTLTAIPDLKNQWVGIIGRGKLTIRPQSNDILIGKLEDLEYAQVHQELPNGWDDLISEQQLEFRPTKSNKKPFEVRLRNGVIHSIAVDKTMTNNDVNQLKAVLSQLQVDTRAENVIKCRHNQLPEDNGSQAVYKVMEPTVTGKCETLYDITPLPEYLVQAHPEWAPIADKGMHYRIVKTKNYDNCEQRLGYHFGLSGANDWEANTNTMGEAVTKSAVSKIVVSGRLDNYIIQSSVTINKVIAKPGQNDQKYAEVVGAVNLTLESVQETQNRLKVQTEDLVDIGNLVYSYNLPSDVTNQIRPMGDSSEEEHKITNELRKESRRDNDEYSSNQLRSRRSLKGYEKRRSTESDSSSLESGLDSDESHEKFHMPVPTLTKAPENPLSPMFIAYDGHSIQNVKDINVLEMAQKLAEEIGNDLQIPNEIPIKNSLTKFQILSELIRTMDAKQIELLAGELYIAEAEDVINEKTTEEEQLENENVRKTDKKQLNIRIDAWKAFRDAVTDAGTGPAITQTMEWIVRRKIHGENAAQLIATWPKTIREPTEALQRAFFMFAISDSIEEQSNVNVTALMALTRFLNMAQVNNQTAHNNYPVHSFGRLADRNNRFIELEVIPVLAGKLDEAVRRGDAPNVLVYVRALGNMGHWSLLNVFEPYLEGKKVVTDFQRLAMVVALDEYRLNYPATARSVLYKIYQNVGERHELRVAAVFQLIRTKPDAAMLQRMAEQTNTESNPHVRAAVISAIKSAAELQAPEWTELAADARAAAKLLPEEKFGMQYSQTEMREFVLRELNTVFGEQVSWIIGEDSVLPNGVFVETEKNLGGFRYRSKHHAMVSSINRMINVLVGKMEWSKKNEKSNNERRFVPMSSFARLLNIQSDEAEELEGQLLINVLNGQRFITFDKHTLERFPRQVRKAVVALKNGYRLNYSKMNNAPTTISFPMETGLPFIYNKHEPTLVKYNGKIRVRSTPEMTDNSNDKIQMPNKLNLTGEIDIVFSKSIDASVGFVNPADQQRYKAGYTQKLQVYVPVRVSVDIDLRTLKIESEIRPRESTKRVQLLHLSSWPYTGRSDVLLRPIAESKNKKLIHTRPSQPIDFTFGDRLVGFTLAVQGKHEIDPTYIADAWMKHAKLDIKSMWSLVQTLNTPELFELNVNFEPERSRADSAKFRFAYNIENTEDKNKETYWKHPRARFTRNSKGNLAIPSLTTEDDIHDRRYEILRNAGISNADAQVMQIAVEFNGKDKDVAAYDVTVANAMSLVGDRSRLLIVMNTKNVLPTNSKRVVNQVCIHLDGKHSIAPEMNFNKALNHSTESEYDLHVTYGDKCASESAIYFKANTRLGQTDDLKQYLRTSPMAKLCLEQMQNGNNQLPACQRITDQAHTLDEASIQVNLEKTPKWTQKLAYKLYTWTLQKYYPLVTEIVNIAGENTKDQLEIYMHLAPDMKSLNWTIVTPESFILLQQTRVPHLIHYAKNPSLSPWEHVQRRAINYLDTCVIDDNQLNTFDDRTINHELGKTWHVAMRTVQPKNTDEMENTDRRRYIEQQKDENITIFVRDSWYSGPRDQKKQPMNKDVNIEIDQYWKGIFNLIELRPASKSDESTLLPRMLINRKEVYPTLKSVVVLDNDDSTEKPLVQAFATPEGEIRLIVRSGSRQLKITYDGQRIKIQANGLFRKNVRGLCGTYTGQKETNMKTPDNCILRRDQDFVAMWAVFDDDENQGPAMERVREAMKAKCLPQEVLLGNVISEQEAGRKPVQLYDDEKLSTDLLCEANRQIVFQQVERKLCFSKRTLPVCPKGCKPLDTIERDIDAHCRSDEDTAAKTYRDLIRTGQNPNMHKQPTNGKVTYALPTQCIRV